MLRCNIIKKVSLISLMLICLIANLINVQAANIKYSPTPQFYINDFANILSAQTEQEIFDIGRVIEEKTTAQLVVVTVTSMDGDYIESYANTLFNRWKIGSKEKNNGVLLIISKNDRKIRIEVGYGLEGAINDAKAGRILDKYAVIPLKENNYDKAVIDSVRQIQGEIYNEYGVENPGYVPIGSYDSSDVRNIIIGIIIFIILAIITKGKIFEYLFWIIMLSGRRRRTFRRRRRLFWWGWIFWRRWFFKGILKI